MAACWARRSLRGELPKAPLGDEAGLEPAIRHYGDVAAITVERDKVFVMRIWIKRNGAWRALVVHEVSQNLPAAPHGAGRKEWDNPCHKIPYEPRNADERDCLAAWQKLEIAVMRHEPEVWASHVADEFMVVGAARRHSKADRKAVLEEQKKTDANSAPAPLVSARMFNFPNANGHDLRAPAVSRQGEPRQPRLRQTRRPLADGGQLPDHAGRRASQDDLTILALTDKWPKFYITI